MANVYISTNRGTGMASMTAGVASVTVGAASASSNDVELRITDAASLTKADVEFLVDKIVDYVRNSSNFPPL